ncbi:MAG TPA: hypothetical protein VKL99_11465 [Candidatus Angelobacter sp.]|nr:hypothetical protein [Candidatus Angelobacter sp.]
MSAFDWLQIVLGVRYCFRRVIIAVASMLACKAAARLVTAKRAENAE